jgi:two-component system sensor kinase FixL
VRKHVKVNLQLDAKLAPVCGDRVQLQQVLLNLLLNAADSMTDTQDSDRVIELAAANEGGQVHLQVIDHGLGIPPEKLEAVFESFYTTKSHGLGLGLAISRSIVAAHHGQLWATNNEHGGACFHLTLPMLASAHAQHPSLRL